MSSNNSQSTMGLQNSLDMPLNPDLGGEMAAVPFAALIGGAFTAVTDAQNQATLTTINFIQSVGFKPSPDGNPSKFGDPIMVEFKYDRPGGIFGMTTQKHVVRVPFLTMIPMPSLRIQSLKVSFSVKLTQTRTSNLSFAYSGTKIATANTNNSGATTDDQRQKTGDTTTLKSKTSDDTGTSKTTTDVGFRSGYLAKDTWTTSSSMVGVISDQSSNTHGQTVTREYSMKIVVSAVQDEMPSGMSKIMDILTSIIQKKTGDAGLSSLLGNMGNLAQPIGTSSTAGSTANSSGIQ